MDFNYPERLLFIKAPLRFRVRRWLRAFLFGRIK